MATKKERSEERDPNAPVPQDEVTAAEAEQLRDLNERLRGTGTPNVGRTLSAREGGSGATGAGAGGGGGTTT